MSDIVLPGSANASSRRDWAALARTGLLSLTILSITFPYIQLVPLGSYTQPYALFLCMVVLATSRLDGLTKMRWTDSAGLFSLAIVGVLLFVLTCYPYRNIQEYKYLLNFVSPLVIASACFTLLRWDHALVAKLVAGSVLVWFWIAMTQSLINPVFMVGLLGEWGAAAGDIAASGRGVIALAPEPTHHAFHMLLLGGCVAILGRHRWAMLFCLVSVLLLARSANGALVLGLAVAIAIVIYWPRVALLLFAGAILLFSLKLGHALSSVAEGNRILTLLGIVLDNPLSLISEDYSTNIRIGGALAGFLSLAQELFFPHGLSYAAWEAARLEIMADFPFLMDLSTAGIPSGFGVILFQAGFLVAPFIFIATRRMVMACPRPLDRVLVLCVPLVFVFQYYISAPQFGLAYACAMFAWSRRNAV